VAKIAIAVEGVTVRFGDSVALRSVTLALEPGELLLLLGPSGCGKSTLLRTLAGFVTPDAGRVLFDGTDVTRVPPHERHIGMVFQSFALFPHLSVGENVAFGLREQRRPSAEIGERVERSLSDVKMGGFAARRVDQLSGGEQQRVALARAWALNPEVLFLDEPTANLDPGATHEIERVIGAMHAAGTKIVMVTHNLGQARRIGDEILFLHQGRLVERAPADRFFKRPASPEAAQFLEGELPW
jgi:ABC-type Fe3+/spermidine/putrescine transport system ATPase subunit